MRFRCPVVTAHYRTNVELLLWTVPVTSLGSGRAWCFVDLAFDSAFNPHGAVQAGLLLRGVPEQLRISTCCDEEAQSVSYDPDGED